MFNQNTSVALVPRGECRLVGRERLVVLLDLGPTPRTSASAPCGSTPACRGDDRPWRADDQGREEVERVGIVLGDGPALGRALGNEKGASVRPDVADGIQLGSALGPPVAVGLVDGRMEGRPEREVLEKDRRWARSRAAATVRRWAGRSATRRKRR
jgi:hypothetical protein